MSVGDGDGHRAGVVDHHHGGHRAEPVEQLGRQLAVHRHHGGDVVGRVARLGGHRVHEAAVEQAAHQRGGGLAGRDGLAVEHLAGDLGAGAGQAHDPQRAIRRAAPGHRRAPRPRSRPRTAARPDAARSSGEGPVDGGDEVGGERREQVGALVGRGAVGSPSTPLGATAATPPRAELADQVGEGCGGAGLGLVEAHAAGVEGEQERGLGAPGVGVAVRHRRCPGQDPAALGGERAAARRTASRFPPWPFTNTTPAKASAERPSSTSTVVRASVPIDRVPGKPACSPEAP